MDEKRLLRLVASGIKARRAALGMTIADLAEAADIDTAYLSHILSEERSPSLKVLARLLDSLKLTPQDLFAASAVKKSRGMDGLTRRTRALLKNLNARQQDDLLAIFSKLRHPEEIRALRVLLRA